MTSPLMFPPANMNAKILGWMNGSLSRRSPFAEPGFAGSGTNTALPPRRRFLMSKKLRTLKSSGIGFCICASGRWLRMRISARSCAENQRNSQECLVRSVSGLAALRKFSGQNLSFRHERLQPQQYIFIRPPEPVQTSRNSYYLRSLRHRAFCACQHPLNSAGAVFLDNHSHLFALSPLIGSDVCNRVQELWVLLPEIIQRNIFRAFDIPCSSSDGTSDDICLFCRL